MLVKFLADASSLIKSSAGSACSGAATGACTTTPLPDMIHAATDTLLYIIGALSVVMIIVGGLRYVISAGDPKKTADAKNTIVYAISGVVVAVLAFAIVTFVTTALK